MNPEGQTFETSGEEPNLGFSLEPKTCRQRHNNDKVLMRHWRDRRRQYSPGERNRYTLLRANIRKALAVAGYSEEGFLEVLIRCNQHLTGVNRLEDLPPKVLRKILDNWDSWISDY
jgi:hypothetical protein